MVQTECKKIPRCADEIVVSMIATFDTETVGLFGDIRIIGWYDGKTYFHSTDAREWWDFACSIEYVIAEYKHLSSIGEFEHLVWYAHNLDFDVAKLWAAMPEIKTEIDWNKSIFINFRACKIVFKNGVELRDSMALLPGKLGDVLKSWGTEVGKLSSKDLAAQGGYKDVEDYFMHVPVTDTDYLEYLKHDVIGLHQVLTKLYKFTGLEENKFCKKLTTAGMAISLFHEWFPDEYIAFSKARWRPDTDEKMRRAYYGGRTEVFQTNVSDGYHYDINSLYPYVMGANEYPYSYPEEYTGEEAQKMWEMFLPDALGQRLYQACIVTAKVHVPDDLHIPPLPVRHDGRLVFPTGDIAGTWCGVELENAMKYGCKVIKIIDCMAWIHVASYFAGWVERMSEKKINAKGAEREFYKLLQNSLYGKFAQRREQIKVSEYTSELMAKVKAKGKGFAVRETESGILLDHTVSHYSDFMQPHIAAHITAFARVKWYNDIMMEEASGNTIVYGDTDSVVTTKPMSRFAVHPNKYGLWKLENEVKLGLYISPKLYAEIDNNNTEICKGKGLIGSYRNTLSFAKYEDIAKRLANGESVIELYRGIPNRRRFLRSVLANGDVDEPRYESKSIHANTWQKRKIFWESGLTKPWDMRALERETSKSNDNLLQ